MATKTLGPGDAYSFRFFTRSTAGAPTDADSTPTVTVYRNETTDAWAPTVTKISTGKYRVTGTVPATYAVGDRVEVEVNVVVGGQAGSRVDEFRADVLTNSVAAAVWNSLLASYTTAATIGNKLRTWVLGTDFKAVLSGDTQPTVPADVQKINGQTATASAPVAFPASIGTSTFAGGQVASVSGSVGSVASPVTVGGYATGQSPASLILATPANKLATDTSGFVTATNGGSGGGTAPTVQQIADGVWGATVRSLTDKAGFAPTAAQNAAAWGSATLEGSNSRDWALKVVYAALAGTENATGFVGADGTTQRITYALVNGFRVVSAVNGA